MSAASGLAGVVNMVNRNEKTGVTEMVVAMIASGSIGVFVLKSGQNSYDVVFLRCLVAFACLLPLCAARGMLKREYFQLNKLVPIALAGLLIVANWVLFFMAFPLTSISLATIVYHINPFIVIFAGAIVFRQPVTLSDLAWTLLAFIGLLAVTNPNGAHAAISHKQLIGLGLVLAATTLYSGSVIITKRVTNVPAPFIVLVQTFVGSLALLPFASFARVSATPAQWGYLVSLGVVHTALLYWLVYSALQKLTINTTAILTFIYPLAAVFFDYVFFGHAINMIQAAGAALILLGTLGVKLHWNIRPLLKRA